jgi:hypothetical protein
VCQAQISLNVPASSQASQLPQFDAVHTSCAGHCFCGSWLACEGVLFYTTEPKLTCRLTNARNAAGLTGFDR